MGQRAPLLLSKIKSVVICFADFARLLCHTKAVEFSWRRSGYCDVRVIGFLVLFVLRLLGLMLRIASVFRSIACDVGWPAFLLRKAVLWDY